MKPYSKEALCSALEEVRQQTLSIRAAAKKNSVPVTTLHNRVSGRITMGAKWGKTTLLPLAKEKELINYALQRAEMGIGFSKETFLRFAGQFAKSEGVTFKNSVASEKWWLGLKQRNPEFSLRTAEPTALGRHMSMTRLRISRYFSQLKSVLVENSLLDKSPFIWNMDETDLSLSPKCPKVLARKGSKVVHAKSSSPRELVTIIACGNASGYVIPPHAFIPGKTVRALRSYDTENAPEGTKLSVSDSGWTKQGISELWFSKTFLPNIDPARPQVLIMDGHDSHHHVEFVDAARKAGIILVELPSKTSHFTQPFDRSVFKALKSNWSDHLHRFTSTTGVTVGHAQFFRMFKLAWTESVTAENVASGFLATGICPYNPGAIPDLAYAPAELYTARVLQAEPVDASDLPATVSAAISSNALQPPVPPYISYTETVMSGDVPSAPNAPTAIFRENPDSTLTSATSSLTTSTTVTSSLITSTIATISLTTSVVATSCLTTCTTAASSLTTSTIATSSLTTSTLPLAV